MIDFIVNIAKLNEDIELVWLYGSQAQGTAHSESDVDLAIAFKNHTLPALSLKSRPECIAIEWAEELNMPLDKLSIVDINRIPIALAFNVIEYGQLVYNNNPLRVYQEENRIRSMFEYQLMQSKREAE